MMARPSKPTLQQMWRRPNWMRERLPYFLKFARQRLLCNPRNAAFKASTAAYQNNRGEFTNLIDSQNLLLDIRSETYKALSEEDSGSAQLERAIGAALPNIHPAQSNTDIPNFNIERTSK
jgi:hypothetical protein